MNYMEEDPRIRIERAYGSPGDAGWSYHAMNKESNSIILEGEVERNGGVFGMYHLLLRPIEGGRREFGDMLDPRNADKKIKEILMSEASKLLDSKK
jgi:hypothetical protein